MQKRTHRGAYVTRQAPRASAWKGEPGHTHTVLPLPNRRPKWEMTVIENGPKKGLGAIFPVGDKTGFLGQGKIF